MCLRSVVRDGCPVCAMMARSGTPAAAEMSAMEAASIPAEPAQRLTMRATDLPVEVRNFAIQL